MEKFPNYSVGSTPYRARLRDGNLGLWKSLLIVFETDGNHVDNRLKGKPKVSIPFSFHKL